MSKSVVSEITSKLESIPGISRDYCEVMASLWGRWFDTQAIRSGTTPEALYSSVTLEITDVDSIANQLGRQIDYPDCVLGHESSILMMSTREKIALVQQHFQKKSEEDNANQEGKESILGGPGGKPALFYPMTPKGLIGVALGNTYYQFSNRPTPFPTESTTASSEIAQLIASDVTERSPAALSVSQESILDGIRSDRASYPVNLSVTAPLTVSQNHHYRTEAGPLFKPGAIGAAIMNKNNGTVEQLTGLQEALEHAVSTADAKKIIDDFSQQNRMDTLFYDLAKAQGFDSTIELGEHPKYTVFSKKQISNDVALGNTEKYKLNRDNQLYTSLPSYESILFQYGSIGAAKYDTSQLTEAIQKFNQGASMEHIRQSTGWHRWIDGNWRFEIDDSSSTIIEKELRKTLAPLIDDHNVGSRLTTLAARKLATTDDTVRQYNGNLSGIFDHKGLYHHYPSLRDIAVSLTLANVRFPEGESILSTEPRITVIAGTLAELRKTLLHEIQHVIQQKEALAAGGSQEEFKMLSPENIRRVQMVINDLRFITDYMETKQVPAKDAIHCLNDLIRSDSAHIAEHLDIEEIEMQIRKLETAIRSPFERYKLLAGEYEARDVELRSELSLEDRLAIPPYTLEDIDGDQLEIVINRHHARSDKQCEPKGATLRDLAQQRFHILLTRDSDASTGLHESAHFFLDLYSRIANQPQCTDEIREDYETLCGCLGATPGDLFTTAQHEAFADAVVAYFAHPESRPETYNRPFRRIENTLQELLAGLDGVIGHLNPKGDLSKVIQRMFGRRGDRLSEGQIDFDRVGINLESLDDIKHSTKPMLP